MAQPGRVPVFLDNADPAALEQIEAMAAANGLQLDFMSGPAPIGGQPLPLRPQQIPPPQQALKLKGGMPRPKVTGQSIQKRLANKSTPNRPGNNSMEPFLLDHPYPLCFRALHELEPVGLAELILESHHRGRILFAKIIEWIRLHQNRPPFRSFDDRPVVDTYQLHDIVARNTFNIDPVEESGHNQIGSTSLFVRASYINHSCLPNSECDFCGDLILLHATKPIAKGDEITINYCGFYTDFEERSTNITGVWHFDCACPLCAAERSEPADLRKKRNQMVELANARTKNSDLHTYRSKITVQLVEALDRKIEASYTIPLYDNLPHPGLMGLRTWLFLGANVSDQDPTRAKQVAINWVRAYAFRVETSDQGGMLIAATPNSVAPNQSVTKELISLMTTAFTARARGEAGPASDLIDFTKSMARVLRGPQDDVVAKLLAAEDRGANRRWDNTFR